jgi:hypothetical protein
MRVLSRGANQATLFDPEFPNRVRVDSRREEQSPYPIRDLLDE